MKSSLEELFEYLGRWGDPIHEVDRTSNAIIARRSGEKGRTVAAILASAFWAGYALFVALSL